MFQDQWRLRSGAEMAMVVKNNDLRSQLVRKFEKYVIFKSRDRSKITFFFSYESVHAKLGCHRFCQNYYFV